MNSLILLGVLGGIGWWGYKKFTEAADEVSKRVRQTEKEKRTGAQGTLIQDPKTGEYRVKKEDE